MTTVYVELLDEGVEVWRPVSAVRLSNGSYVLEGPVPEDERWAFEPGQAVRCELRTFSNGERGLVAARKAEST